MSSKLIRIGLTVALAIAIIGGVFTLTRQTDTSTNGSSAQPSSSYDVQSISLEDYTADRDLGGLQTLSINGQLQTNGSIVVTPTNRPKKGVIGQIYYDQETNTPYVYNGSDFVSLLAGQAVSNIGGANGSIALGQGLELNNNQLSLSPTVQSAINQSVLAQSGVLSLQGQSGNVTLNASAGIAVNGTTISNTGVVSVQGQTGDVTLNAGAGVSISGTTVSNTGVLTISAASPQVTVTQTSPGAYSIGTAGALVTGIGTTGSIALFSGNSVVGNSMLSQSGGSILLAGDLQASGGVSADIVSNLSPGQDLTLSAGSDQVVLVSEGRSFQLPSSGAGNQTICTVGMNCTAGGGSTYAMLQPGTVQSDTGAGPSLYINNTGGGDLLRLQGNGLDIFSVANNGSVSITGDLAVSGAINGATVNNANINGGTITGANINNASITGGSLTNTSVNGLTVTGAAIGASGALSISTGLNENLNLSTLGTGVVTVGSSDIQGTGALQLSAGGVDQDLTLSGSGIGGVAIMIPRFIGPNGATYSFDVADPGSVNATICTSVGNCIGPGPGVGGGGTAGTIAVFDGAGFTLTDSILTQSAGTVTVTGDLAATNLQGDGGAITNLDASNITTGALSDGRLSNNVALYSAAVANFAGGLQQGGNDVCTMSGNCAGSGAGLGGSGTPGAIAVFNGTGYTLTDSLLTQSAGLVTVTGDLAADNIQGNGSGITNVNAVQLNGQTAAFYLNAGNLGAGTLNDARLSGNVTLQGNLFNGAGQLVQLNASNQLPSVSGALLSDLNASNITSGTLPDSRLSANVALLNAGTNNFTGNLQQGGNDVCTIAGNCAGAGGGVTTAGGTTNQLARFSGAQSLVDSIVSDDGSTVSIGGTLAVNVIVPSAAMTIGSTSQSLILQGNGATQLTATSGGSTSTLVFATPAGSNKTVTVPNASGTVAVSATGPISIDVNGNVSCATCVTSGGGGGGASAVDSLNGLTGAITLANTTTVGQTITVDDATTAAKGIASFNSTNFTVANGSVDTVQDIAVNSSPVFDSLNITNGLSAGTLSGNGAGITNVNAVQLGGQAGSYYQNATNMNAGILDDTRLSSNVTLQGNTFNGANQLVRLDASGQLPAVSGVLVTNLNASNIASGILADARLSGNVALYNATTANFTGTLQQAGNDVCTIGGNCAGVGGGVTVSSNGAANTIAMFTGNQTVANSILFQNGAGTLLTVSGAGLFSGDLGVVGDITVDGGMTLSALSTAGIVHNNASGVLSTSLVTNADLQGGTYSAITGTGVLSAGSIGSGFGTISTTNDINTTNMVSAGTLRASAAIQINGVTVLNNSAAIQNLTGYSQNGGNFSQSGTGTFSTATGSVNLNGATTINSSLNVSGSSTLANLTVNGPQFTNNASTLNTSMALSNFASNATIGTAAATVDARSSFTIPQTTAGVVLTLPNPTTTSPGRIVYMFNIGTQGFTMHGVTVPAGYGQIYMWNGSSWVLGANGGGTSLTLQGAYDGGNTLNTADGRNIGFTLNNTATDANFITNIASGSTGQFKIQNNGTDIVTIGSAGQLGLSVQGAAGGLAMGGDTQLYRSAVNRMHMSNALTIRNATDTASALQVQTAAGLEVLAVDTASNKLTVSNADITGNLTVGGGLQGTHASLSGSLAIQTGVDSATALRVQDMSGVDMLTVDTIAKNVSVSDLVVAAGGSLSITGGATGTRPASPSEGMVYFDTTTKQLVTYTNGKWQADRSVATKIVAPSNASQAAKDSADYVADGTADEIEINAALAASAGGRIYLLEGTFVASTTILIPNNTTLAGAGRGTVIEMADTDVTDNLIENTDTSTGTGITIQNLRLEGRKDLNTTGDQHGIYLNGMGAGSGASAREGAVITSLWINNFNSRAISLLSSNNNVITNNSMQSNTGYGVTLGGSSDYNKAISNTVQGSSSYGMNVNNSHYNIISANNVSGNTNGGLYLQNGASNNTASSNNFSNNGGVGLNDSIQVTSSDANSFVGNRITDTAGTGHAINIIDASSDANYLADNYYSGTGAATLNDAGTGTVFGGQTSSSGNFFIQPAGTIELMKNTNITGNLGVGGSLVVDTSTATDDNISLSVTAGGSTGFTGTITSTDLTAIRTWMLPDESGTFCLQGSSSCGFATGTTASYIQNQSSSQQATSTYWISGVGRADTALQAPSFDTATAGILTLGGANATSISISDSATLAANMSLLITGGATGTRPASPSEGMIYFDSTTDRLISYANGKWQADRSDAFLVAASNSSQIDKDSADYVTDGDTAAVGDGDQIQINQALSAAPGKKVVLLAGTYILDGSISVPNNTQLSGTGNSTLLTIPNALNANAPMITNSDTVTGTGVTIRDLKIDGNRANQSSGNMDGIYLNGIGSLSFETPGAQVSHVTVVNVRVNGISASNGSDMNTISNSTIVGNGGNGIETTGYANMVSDNLSMNNEASGIYVEDASTVNGNTLRDNSLDGIRVVGDNVAISGNTSNSNSDHGVRISGQNNTVSDNTIWTNNDYGIYLDNSSTNNISGNNIARSGGNGANNGIYINSSSSNAITSNTITDSSCTLNCHAINISSSASVGNYLSGNNFTGTVGTPGINDLGTRTSYANQVDANGNLINRGSGGMTVNAATATASLSLQGGLANAQLPTPAQPVVSQVGAAGSTSYGYRITALDGTGETLPSTEGTTATGNAILSGTNYNTISWTQIPGAVQYRIYRTSSAGTPSSLGLIGTVTGGSVTSFNDIGITATTAVPVENTTGGATIAGTLQGNTSVLTPSLDSIDGTYLHIGKNTGTISLGTSSTQSQIILLGAGGAAAKFVSIGSVSGNGVTLLSGGTGGVTVTSTGGFSYQNNGAGYKAFEITASGGVVARLSSGSSFNIQDTGGVSLLNADGTAQVITVRTLEVSYDVTVNGHIVGGGATPTLSAGPSACTSPTISVSGTDTAGVITVTTGASGCSGAGHLARLTFDTSFASIPVPVLTPLNSVSSGTFAYVNDATRNAAYFDLNIISNPTASTTYKWSYHVIQ